MGVLDVLSGLAMAGGQAAAGEAIDQQTAVKNAIAQQNAKREADLANITALLRQSQIQHLNAESQKLSPDDIVGQHTDNAGNMFNVHRDGTLSPATMRGAAPTIASTSATPAASAGGPSASGGGAPVASTPSATAPAAPNFGPRKTYQRVPVNVDGKPGFALQDNEGNFVDPTTHQPIAGKVTPFTPPDKPQVTIQSSSDPNVGAKAVVIDSSDPSHPKITTQDIPGISKGSTGSGGASLSPEDRAKMLSQAQLDNQTMRAYEAKVLGGQAHVGTMEGVAGALSAAHGGVMGDILGIAGNTATGALDPDYQKYLTAQQSYGRIMGNLQSKRYTDHQAEIERSISGLRGNDLNSTIQYKQDLRDRSLADAMKVGSSGVSSGGGSTATAPSGAVPWWKGKTVRP